MNQKKYLLAGVSAVLALSLAACGNNEKDKTASEKSTNNAAVAAEGTANNKGNAAQEAVATEQTVTYLGKDYVVPAKINNIVAASLESMEDAAILGVKPVGVLAIADAIPGYLSTDLAGASLVGDKFAPSNEAILQLDPDVILGSSKFGEDVAGALNKIQTMIPYSHISTNWKDNLLLLGQLSGKTTDAEKIISDYESKAAGAKAEIGEKLKDQSILVIRIRQGSMCVYPAGVYLNPVIYEDLGAAIPEVISSTEAQAELSLEALADINPDYIFLQFETSENTDNATALDDLLKNPIFKSVTAVKNNHVFVNAIDPLAQGGTAWSKVRFLDAAIENLLK
ncbi:ABC transporter substrate-binding protein [Paenibacillus sp. FSL R5-0887]|jgi:iron complex transport system substrate-binding protein|uniref:ABC transporter substrate-binding protein n=1 Tax=Paenibacillus TaxID=44249 RepID=UPI00096FB39E|nr:MULTISPECIES: ABC transporter substrate-binding protein [Paenibacillus]MDH6426986.1 iron complex transport system substrate-binding protein [Paenibacillus sp. PastH-4]MDH6443014.1 iron complex transport system substrate-binding protein [Paenibacillus sp. PastF-4]MDH6526278.1 iron complex transport system substrate-binding protein [Paenibacillus sp. PastH-3]OMD19530.1 iron-uptake system-binding protein [Paenibacillus odorifer]OMD67065.1 iron-uptake system-binding protein [Paenibacillus odori